ncbi:MAG: class I SAM-dependent methyltransferase, partial [Bacteroidota bacterium]
MKCRFCGEHLNRLFIDLKNSPPSNSFLSKEMLNYPEVYYPLKVLACDNCFLVQVDEHKNAREIFDNQYVYFSSFSKSWLKHAQNYCEMMIDRFKLGKDSYVAEVASNDGYLLQYFLENGIPVLGIEPTANTASVAIDKGIETVIDYFGVELAQNLAKTKKADLIVGNNVLAHVPDINDFVRGLKVFLEEGGTITMEFPHLYQLVKYNQFDTIYHEHFSYLSLGTVKQIFAKHDLEIFDVQELATHGGSLRIFAKHIGDLSKPIEDSVNEILSKELSAGMSNSDYYSQFQGVADKIKTEV